MNIGNLIATIGVDARNLDKGLGQARRKFKSFGRETKRLGKDLSMGLTAPLAAVGFTSFNVAASFEESMAKVKAVSGATAAEFKGLESEALRLGSSTKFTASEVSGLQLEFAKLGFTSDEINKVTESTLALAQASGSDLARSAEVAGATLRGFGLDASETQRVTDVMASSFSSSALDMDTFADSMKFVAPVAKAAGLDIETVSGMLGSLANAGIKGSQAGTALRRIISELGATGGDVSGAIEKLAAEGLNLADAKDEVGRSAQSALLVLSKSGEETAALTEQFRNSKGAAQDMADIMGNTTAGALARMQSAIEGAQIKIGNALAPTILKLVGFVERAAAQFSAMDSSSRNFIIAAGAVAAALGPILVLLPSLASGFGILAGAILSPIGLIIGAVAALVAAFFFFFDDIKQPLTNTINAFITLFNENENLRIAVGLFKQAFVAAFTIVKQQVMNVVNSFGVLFDALKTAFTDGFAAAGQVLTDGFKDIVEDTAQAGKDVYEGFTEAIDSAKKRDPIELVTVEDLDRARDRITSLIPTFGGSGGTSGGASGQGVQQMQPISLGGGNANNGGLLIPPEDAEDAANAISNFNREVAVSVDLSSSIANGFTDIADGIGAMAAGTLTFKGFIGGILGKLADLLQQIGAGFIAAAVAAKTFYANLIANPPLAIAAGIALVAAGAIIKGLAARMQEQPPALAEGGLAFGRTLVEVGEYSGAGANPEVIAPLDKLQGMLHGSGTVQVQGVLRGKDILLSSQRATRDLSSAGKFPLRGI
ncbi:MAG: hypothetical protein CL526_12640 [Aequorivita sp.]|nr:hypothetical protein [Aequorivita sp.]